MTTKNRKSSIDHQSDEHKVYATPEEQILDKTGMWIGSNKNRPKLIHIFDGLKFQKQEVDFNPALAKLIEEVLMNSADEHTRTKSNPKKRGWILDQIYVDIDESGSVKITDNGGISVYKHSTGEYSVEVIFGKLFSSSNYDKNEQRKTTGTNGVGASLTNLFSTNFSVTTSDGKNELNVEWKDNKSTKSKPKIKKVHKHNHGTQINFKLDLERFNMDSVPYGVIKYIERLCILTAGAYSGENGLEIIFNGTSYKFDSFSEYVKLYHTDEVISESNDRWELHVVPNYGDEAQRFGIINGAECMSGTHMEYSKALVNDIIKKNLNKQKITNLTTQQISASYHIFNRLSINNVEYDSQTKTKLESDISEVVNGKTVYPTISKEFENSLLESGIISYLKELSKSKDDALNSKEIKKKIQEVNQADPRNVEKLTDAMGCSKKSERSKCELWIFEGDSAGSGFKPARNPQTQGCILLRGKSLNSAELTLKRMLENNEIRSIFIALGLNPKDLTDLSGLRYHKIVLCTDMDMDGHSIIGQLLTFFVYHVPILIELGLVYRAISPLYKTTKGKEIIYHTSEDSYLQYSKKNKGFKTNYYKGVGSLPKSDYKVMLKNPNLERFKVTDACIETMDTYMKKDDENKTKRKEILKN